MTKKIIYVKGIPQEQYYTCGCASFRTVINTLGLPDVEEMELEKLLGTTHRLGTHYDNMIKVASKFDLDVKSDSNSTIKDLDDLIANDWVVVIVYSIDVPHYSVYLGNNNNHLFLYDPDTNVKTSYQIKKFVRNYWKVDVRKLSLVIYEWNLDLTPEKDNSNKWFVAYKKKDE